jgi:hypothetical protein
MLTEFEGGFRVKAIDPGRMLVIKIDRAYVQPYLERQVPSGDLSHPRRGGIDRENGQLLFARGVGAAG